MKTRILIAAMLMGTAVNAEMVNDHGMIRAEDLTDADLYTAAVRDGYKWDAEIEFGAIDPEWNRIGEIEDLVLDADMKVVGVVAEVGGFLDMGDKHVVMSMDEVSMFKEDHDGDSDWVFVTGLTEELLEEREGVDEGFWE